MPIFKNILQTISMLALALLKRGGSADFFYSNSEFSVLKKVRTKGKKRFYVLPCEVKSERCPKSCEISFGMPTDTMSLKEHY